MTTPDSNPPEQDSTPLALPEETAANVTAPPSTSVDRTLWYTIGGIVLISCCGLIMLAFLFTRTSQFKKLTTFPGLEYTPPPTPNMRATEQAWKPTTVSPSLGSKQETERALAEDQIPELRWFASYRPPMPEVDQPGAMYAYAVYVPPTQEALWEYGWCTLTQEILDQNFAQMKIDFFLNGKPVPNDIVGVEDYQQTEERFCRTYNILVKDWPPGTHLLAIDVTFLAPTDDGWNVYPAGTHTFRYYVTVSP